MRKIAGSFSIEHLWALIVLAGIFAFLNTSPIRPHDFWWHMQAGKEILATGHIPAVDTLSFTATGRPYTYWVYWLMEAALYLFYSIGGPALVILVHSLSITAAYGLLLHLCRREAGAWRPAVPCVLFAAAQGVNDWNVRPQAIAFPLAALVLWAIYENRRSLRWRWLIILPVSLLIWVNSHPSFVIGLMLLGVWLLSESIAIRQRLLRPALAMMASGVACLFNPRGPGIITYLGSMSQSPVIQNLVWEWRPPSFDTLHGSIFLTCLLLSAVILALSPRRPDLFQVLTFFAFAGLGLKTSRGIVWFGMVMAPVLAGHLAALIDQARHPLQKTPRLSRHGRLSALPPSTGSLALNYFLAGAIVSGVLLSLPWFKDLLLFPENKAGLISSETPVEATRFLLKEQWPGKLFHAQAFGSYLIWAAQPDYPVFVDPRIELYPPRIWLDYLSISEAQCDWEQRLEQYGVNTLMLNPKEQSALVRAASESPNWKQVYQDPYAVIFVRVRPLGSGRP